MKRQMLAVLALRLAVSTVTMVIPDVALSHEWGEEMPAFKIGDSCAALAYVEEAELRELTSPENMPGFDAFCFPEEPFFCSDYTSFVGDLGEMDVGPDGYMCRFIPEP